MKLEQIILMVILMGLAGALLGQEAYRWVDEDGNVHYSDQPPEEQREDAERVQLGDGIEDQVLEEDPEADNGDNGAILSDEECAGLESRVAEMREADVLYELGEDGERQELEAEAAAEEIRRLEARLDAYCD